MSPTYGVGISVLLMPSTSAVVISVHIYPKGKGTIAAEDWLQARLGCRRAVAWARGGAHRGSSPMAFWDMSLYAVMGGGTCVPPHNGL